jgi:hypothetical protein
VQSVANSYPGQWLTVFSADIELADVYRRHPERDGEAFLGLRSAGAIIRVPPASGPFTPIPVSTPAQGQRVSAGGTDSLVSGGNATIRAQVESSLSGSHFRNVVVNDNAPIEATHGSIGLVPMNAPVGTLCGVISKGGAKYYIWRKTAANRRTFDYNRRLMQFVVQAAGGMAGLD